MNDDFESRWKRSEADRARVNTLNKDIVFTALAAAGITAVWAGFDGEGDEGQINDITARVDAANVEFPRTQVVLHRAQWGCEEIIPEEMSLREAVEQLCYGYLEQQHGGWENDGGGYGEFRLCVAARSIELEFNARYVDVFTEMHTF